MTTVTASTVARLPSTSPGVERWYRLDQVLDELDALHQEEPHPAVKGLLAAAGNAVIAAASALPEVYPDVLAHLAEIRPDVWGEQA